MRKRQISPTPPNVPPPGETWLDVDSAALVEVTSEENGFPIESALLGGENQGWRAAYPGTQTIRLIFNEPQNLSRIWLDFKDAENSVHRSSSCGGLLTVEILFEKSSASSGTSARPIQYRKQRTML